MADIGMCALWYDMKTGGTKETHVTTKCQIFYAIITN